MPGVKTVQPQPTDPIVLAQQFHHVGCVSYLNAKPLIEGLDQRPDTAIHYDVPSRLLSRLDGGDADLVLCPVIDYHRSRQALEIVPVGGIGCQGPTLTVRLYSQVPIASIHCVHADHDSHTSVVLLRIILSQLYHSTPQVVPYHSRDLNPSGPSPAPHPPESVLLIGDKVVTDHPPDRVYPHQLDLGQAWLELTGLPFVFAVWMTPQGRNLGSLPQALRQLRIINGSRLDQIAMRYAPQYGWPTDLAQRYLNQTMRYEINRPQIQAIDRFSAMARDLGVIDHLQPMRVRWLS